MDPDELAKLLWKRAKRSDQLLRYIYDRLEGYPAQSAKVDLNESMEIHLTWADGTPLPPRPGHVALPRASGEVVEGEARDLSALPPAEPDAEQ